MWINGNFVVSHINATYQGLLEEKREAYRAIFKFILCLIANLSRRSGNRSFIFQQKPNCSHQTNQLDRQMKTAFGLDYKETLLHTSRSISDGRMRRNDSFYFNLGLLAKLGTNVNTWNILNYAFCISEYTRLGWRIDACGSDKRKGESFWIFCISIPFVFFLCRLMPDREFLTDLNCVSII